MQDLRMPDLNTVLIAGNLTRDPAFRKTTNGTPVTNFWIASNRRFKDNNGQWRENVCYVGVVAWYKLAENCAENLRKGSAVIVEGELQSRSLRGEDGRGRNVVEVKARRVQFLNKRDDAAEEEYAGAGETGYEDSDDPVDSHEDSLNEPRTENRDAGKPAEDPERKNDENNPEKGKFDFGYQDLKLS